MHKSIIIIFLGLLVILLPLGTNTNNSNVNVIASFDNQADRQQVTASSLKCNNINANVNGLELDVFPPFLGGEVTATAADDETDLNSFANNGANEESQINDFRFICINNNNNTVNGGGNDTIPPQTPPPEELANLNVIKNVVCRTTNPENNPSVCDYVLANISPSDSNMTLTGIDNDPEPSEFPGSSTVTNVQLGAGGYILTEDHASTVKLQSDLRSTSITTRTVVDPGSDCVGFFDGNTTFINANATISAGESQICSLTNTIVVNDGTAPILAQNLQDSADNTLVVNDGTAPILAQNLQDLFELTAMKK
jgi:hypothetical protein